MEIIGKKCQYIRELDGAKYEGVIEIVNDKAGTVVIKGGWTPECRYVARIAEVNLI